MRRLVLALAFAFVSGSAATTASAAVAKPERVRIVTTAGSIVVALDPKRAPKTVANFLQYVDRKFYNGGTFFRVIPGFVIQGGNKPRESPADRKIPLEDPKTTGVRNVDGAIAMARTADPNSATSEFFIDDGPQAALDAPAGQPGYAAFGRVVSGMNVVRTIVHGPAEAEMLLRPVTIVRIERLR